MEYIYFQLDKNPRQVKKLSLSSIDIDMRIEWNTRSKCWYVLGYVGDDLVLRNTKVIPNQMYSFDLDSEYDIPYRFMITTEYKNYNWDTNTLFMLFEDNMNKIDEGLTEEGYLVDRRMGTTSDTHSKVKLKSEYNNYLFDVVKVSSEAGVTITCVGAVDSFSTIGLPQGRWDFSINGKRHVTADETAMIEMLNEYGITITDAGDGKYHWSNTTDVEVKIEGYYPYAVGYPLSLDLESNETLRILSKDDNNWVNRFTVCLSSFVDTVWEVYKTEVSEDYNNLVFRARKSLTGVKPTKEEALIAKYKSGLDSYSSSIVDELTGVSDWVLDPENNRIKYFEAGWYGSRGEAGGVFKTKEEACSATYQDAVQFYGSSNITGYELNGTICTVHHKSTDFTYQMVTVTNKDEPKTIPLETVVQKVISNATNGDTNAQDLLNTLNKYDSYAEVEILPLVVDQYKQGLDTYSSGIVDELAGVNDWVIDPENNQIVYYKDPEIIDPNSPTLQKRWCWDHSSQRACGTSPASAGQAFVTLFNHKKYVSYYITTPDLQAAIQYEDQNGQIQTTYILYADNPHYNPNAEVEREEKYIPLEVVAQQVISNAEAGNADAQEVILSYSQEASSSVNTSDIKPQFDNNIYNFGIIGLSSDLSDVIKINWESFGYPEYYNYYLSSTPMDINHLPEGKVKYISGDVRSYVDTAIDAGETYYVAVGSVKNSVEKLSAVMQVSIGDAYFNDVDLLIVADTEANSYIDHSINARNIIKRGSMWLEMHGGKKCIRLDGYSSEPTYNSINGCLISAISPPSTNDYTIEIVAAYPDTEVGGARLWEIGTENANRTSILPAIDGWNGELLVNNAVRATYNNIYFDRVLRNHTLMRKDGVTAYYVDGIKIAQTTDVINISADKITIGAALVFNGPLLGWVHALRITKAARYDTSGFIPDVEFQKF